MNLRCIIIDDEPNALSLLEMLISQNTRWQLMAKCYDAPDALSLLKTVKTDLVFLDINMPRLSGMELAGLLPADTRIVFTTAYSGYAAESYTFQTIDYLLKPITLKRFLASVQKVENYFGTQGNGQTYAVGMDAHFFVKSGKVLRNILLSDIRYFEGEKEYVKLVIHQEEILIYRRLKDIEEQLSAPFIRVHNSYIVNTRHINKIQDNHIYISGKHIPISEKFKGRFMEIIQQRIF